MKKKIAALLCGWILLGCNSGFAIVPEERVTEAGFYTGTFYFCDPARNKVVLKNVKPFGTITEQNTVAAQEAEYIELDVLGEVRVVEGTVVPLENCNRFADSNVRVLMIRSEAKGLQVVTIQFL